MTMQGETTAIRITEDQAKLDVFPQNRTPSSGRASAKSWQYRWVSVLLSRSESLFTRLRSLFTHTSDSDLFIYV